MNWGPGPKWKEKGSRLSARMSLSVSWLQMSCDQLCASLWMDPETLSKISPSLSYFFWGGGLLVFFVLFSVRGLVSVTRKETNPCPISRLPSTCRVTEELLGKKPCRMPPETPEQRDRDWLRRKLCFCPWWEAGVINHMLTTETTLDFHMTYSKTTLFKSTRAWPTLKKSSKPRTNNVGL